MSGHMEKLYDSLSVELTFARQAPLVAGGIVLLGLPSTGADVLRLLSHHFGQTRSDIFCLPFGLFGTICALHVNCRWDTGCS